MPSRSATSRASSRSPGRSRRRFRRRGDDVPRVIGIDPGTVSIDVCGLDDGRLFLDESYPTREALSDAARFVALLESHAPLDLVAGPSGYGLPLRRARDLTETDLRLAYLAVDGEAGGIGGLRSLARALAASGLPVVFTPGVVHLGTVPEHRKVNRVDMGTADKVCATALAVRDYATRRGCDVAGVSLIHLELGGAFSAAIAVEHGQIVDGVGGSSGPLGLWSPGALDGEVAYLAGTITKGMLFEGGAGTLAGEDQGTVDWIAAPSTGGEKAAWFAYIEGAVKAIATLLVSAPSALEVVISGRVAMFDRVRNELARRLTTVAPQLAVHLLTGFAKNAKQGAQGAALIANGLAGGQEAGLVRQLGIQRANGTVLDHIVFFPVTIAYDRLGIERA
jgi:predicted butyrate kinase (DUF1464 family)